MIHRMSVVPICICIGIGLLGIVGNQLPFLSAAEQNLGLHLLFLMRGPEKAPADVVVVAIDRESAKALNLPTAPHKWPRKLHARLLERLKAQQVAVVAFDLIFYEHQDPVDDQAFAEAIRKADNVILTQTIDRRTMPLDDPNGTRSSQVNIERILSAIPMLADAAVGQAPFPLPKVPNELSQYWRFSPGSGDAPTLPVVTLHAYALQAFDCFVDLLQKVDPVGAAILPVAKGGKFSARQIIATIRPLYGLFQKKPGLASQMLEDLENHPPPNISAHTVGLVKALIGLYRPGHSRYLNLYGPPGTIDTISYYKLLDPTITDQIGKGWPSLKGRAVFVGQTQSDWFKANDGFYTAFTGQSGMDISGVEIAATAFANLLEGKAVHPMEPSACFAILFGWGVLGTLVSLQFSSAGSAAGLLLLNGIYGGMVYIQFKSGGIWYPLVIPIMVQTPAAFIAGLVWK
jgi:adenylate cyclase